jgi:hypothetical protein
MFCSNSVTKLESMSFNTHLSFLCLCSSSRPMVVQCTEFLSPMSCHRQADGRHIRTRTPMPHTRCTARTYYSDTNPTNRQWQSKDGLVHASQTDRWERTERTVRQHTLSCPEQTRKHGQDCSQHATAARCTAVESSFYLGILRTAQNSRLMDNWHKCCTICRLNIWCST